MLPQLTAYFFRYKAVGIPGLGSFTLVQQPAHLDVARQLLHPPVDVIEFSEEDGVSEHQLNTLAFELDRDKNSIQKQLVQLGAVLREQISEKPFVWRGMGVLEGNGSAIRFNQQPERLWEPLPAKQVARENALQSGPDGYSEVPAAVAEAYPATEDGIVPQEAYDNTPVRRPVVLVLAWIAVVLALCFLLYQLYTSQWQTAASGSQQKINLQEPRPLSK